MHIMLFGGSFDPPHNGHSQIAHAIIENKIADQIWFIPCYSHPFSKSLSASHHRLNMVSFLTNSHILVNNYEIEKEGMSFSFDTLSYFQKTQPQHRFSWLMGSDQLVSFHKWKNYKELLGSIKVYVYPREGFPFDPLYENMVPLNDFPLITISSTIVREKVKCEGDISGLVPEKVEEYISEHNLYREANS